MGLGSAEGSWMAVLGAGEETAGLAEGAACRSLTGGGEIGAGTLG